MPAKRDPSQLFVVIPTYGHFEYAERAVASLFENTRSVRPIAIVVDDATPGGRFGWIDRLRERYGPIILHDRDENGGLTRCWNLGLLSAYVTDAEYACVTNSDVVFSLGWDGPIIKALEEYDLVGPVTNAPGNNPEQDVRRYIPRPLFRETAEPIDSPRAIERVAGYLATSCPPALPDEELNGFCMVARTEAWWANAYDGAHVFRPRNDFNSKGQPNPTPLMTLNDCELCGRFRRNGRRIGIARGSYVFHYRSVSRGDAYRQGAWARMANASDT